MSSGRTKPADEVFCRHCGEAIKRRAELCPHCGVRNERSTRPRTEVARSDKRKKFDTVRNVTNLNTDTAAALAYLIPFVGGIGVYTLTDDKFSQFHAAQSIAIFGFFVAASSVLTNTFVATGSVTVAVLIDFLSLIALGGWLFLIATAYQEQTRRIPVAADLADALISLTNKQTPNPSTTNQ